MHGSWRKLSQEKWFWAWIVNKVDNIHCLYIVSDVSQLLFIAIVWISGMWIVLPRGHCPAFFSLISHLPNDFHFSAKREALFQSEILITITVWEILKHIKSDGQFFINYGYVSLCQISKMYKIRYTGTRSNRMREQACAKSDRNLKINKQWSKRETEMWSGSDRSVVGYRKNCAE